MIDRAFSGMGSGWSPNRRQAWGHCPHISTRSRARVLLNMGMTHPLLCSTRSVSLRSSCQPSDPYGGKEVGQWTTTSTWSPADLIQSGLCAVGRDCAQAGRLGPTSRPRSLGPPPTTIQPAHLVRHREEYFLIIEYKDLHSRSVTATAEVPCARYLSVLLIMGVEYPCSRPAPMATSTRGVNP